MKFFKVAICDLKEIDGGILEVAICDFKLSYEPIANCDGFEGTML